MFKIHFDIEGDLVCVICGVLHLTFYKPHQNRSPIVTWFKDCK